MKKEIKDKIKQGYILEVELSRECGELSYDDIKHLGYVRLADNYKKIEGDDLDDAPFDCNGNIYSGEEIKLEKGDYIIVIKH